MDAVLLDVAVANRVDCCHDDILHLCALRIVVKVFFVDQVLPVFPVLFVAAKENIIVNGSSVEF